MNNLVELRVEGLRFGSKYYVDLERGKVFVLRSKGYLREIGVNPTKHGYRQCGMSINGKYTTVMLQRVIYMAKTHKQIPEGYQINHIDYVRTNNSISNLEMITQRENYFYSLDHIMPHAMKNVKLATEAHKRKVYIYDDEKLLKVCESHKEAADYLKCPEHTMADLKRGRSAGKKYGLDKYRIVFEKEGDSVV